MVSKRALITGASSGIGRAMAMALDHENFELFLVARRENKLRDLKTEIKKAKVHLIVSDVTAADFPSKVKDATGADLDILINNAGLALGREKVESADFSDFQQMIDVNITGAFRLVHLVLPWMLRKGGGDIINLCSVAGHYTYQGGSVYCATKHAVKAFTRVLREETCGKNIRVMQISPGMVQTEFSEVRFRGDKKAADTVYQGMTPLTGEDIARMMKFMLDQPRHVVIDEIITMPQDQGSPTVVHRSGKA